ncbi:hypothetical protein [Enterococcus malodoratus]|uniref:hypothetical protein n=1 Tax=Enterococcus malodoratus TaxID=71451 RepID=UPI0022E89AFC|nr:hypothetical protein [Enterococcus malodoratus]
MTTVFIITLFFLDNFLITNIILFFMGNERKDIIITLGEYLNTGVSFFLGIFLVLQLLNFFKKNNAGKVFNSHGNIYHDYSYATFFIAAKVLGYTKVQLAGIPIGMQYKLVLRGTFIDVVEDMWENHYIQAVSDENGKLPSNFIKVRKINFDDHYCNKINLIINDTCLILPKTIDKKYSDNATICVDSTHTSGGHRYLNNYLVNRIRRVIQKELPQEVEEIYIFSTANPKNNLNIITSCFRKFGRFQNQKVYVVQFDGKYYKKATRVI